MCTQLIVGFCSLIGGFRFLFGVGGSCGIVSRKASSELSVSYVRTHKMLSIRCLILVR